MADSKPDPTEVKLLAAMAYGEGSPDDEKSELFALASVLVRQRDARGYTTMSSFIRGESSYSYVVSDGNARYKKFSQASDKAIKASAGMTTAIAAAENALTGGVDLSNGAYFWDGADIKTNYKKHFKVKHGIKFTDPLHNIYNIEESVELVILNKKTKKRIDGKVETVQEEIGRYDHVYESTAAYGGSIFWRNGADYLKTAGAKEYK